MNHTIPNIENAVDIGDRFQANPNEYHYASVKMIFRYLKGAFDYGICYDRSSDFTIYAHIDAD